MSLMLLPDKYWFTTFSNLPCCKSQTVGRTGSSSSYWDEFASNKSDTISCKSNMGYVRWGLQYMSSLASIIWSPPKLDTTFQLVICTPFFALPYLLQVVHTLWFYYLWKFPPQHLICHKWSGPRTYFIQWPLLHTWIVALLLCPLGIVKLLG